MKMRNLFVVIAILIGSNAAAQLQVGAGVGPAYSFMGARLGYKINPVTVNISAGYYPFAGIPNAAISGKANITDYFHVGAMFGGVTVVEITEQAVGVVQSKLITGAGLFGGFDVPLYPKWTMDIGAGIGIPVYERSLKGVNAQYSDLAKTTFLIHLGVYYSFF